jgi:hypothetical protein
MKETPMNPVQTSPLSLFSKLPTGQVLTRERIRLALSTRAVAQMLRQPAAVVASVERKNAVLPPGWVPTLRKLGMAIPEAVWPPTLAPYFGAQLKAEITAKRDLRFSPFSLRKILAVSEEELDSILSGHRLVPPAWLLKLAELGLEVPQEVKRALTGAPEVRTEERAASAPSVPSMAQLRKEIPGISDPTERLNALLAARPGLLRSVEPPRAPRERPELSFRYSEEAGIYFSASASLLDQFPGAFQALGEALRTSGIDKVLARFALLAQDGRHVPR